MSFASRHNKGAIDWNIKTDGFEYKKREDMFKDSPEAVYTIRGLYINTKGKFGNHPVAILENCFVDLPMHMTDEVIDILKSAEDVEDIKAGRVGIKLEDYEANGKTCVGVRWMDV